MKRFLLLVFLINSICLMAQNSSNVYSIEHYKLSYNKSIAVKNVRLHFKGLSADSRCPKEVTCVRAGEAIVTLHIYVDNVLEKELKLVFYPYGVTETLTKFLETKTISIRNLQLLPYPKVDSNQVNSNYYLQFKTLVIN